MKEKAAFMAAFSILLTFGFMPRFADPILIPEVPDLEHIIVASIGEPESVDPAWAYDTASSELIFNVYETLIFYDRESVDRFVPMLAAEWHIAEDGLSYVFEIRQGVKFHNGETLTSEDVEYSFERIMVQDRFGGPSWMIYEALLDCWEANLSDPDWDVKIDNAVQCNTTHVQFILVKPYAPFLQILCQSWSSIVNKKFCLEHGDWPGTWENWQDYHDPDVSPLDSPEPAMCGTGPYKLDYLQMEVEWSIVKFDEYWRGWPASGCGGYVSRATFKRVLDWPRRYDGFISAEYDIIYVPIIYAEQLEGAPGIRCIKELSTLVCQALFFTLNISTTDALGWPNPHMGVPGGLAPGTFNETGIPPDFFNEINVRKGFVYSFNWTKYINEAFQGEAIQPATPIVEGLPYYNSAQEKYYLNLSEAEYYLKKAWNGQVWEKGFTMTLTYYAGSLPRFFWVDMLKENIESLNPRFHINMQGVDFHYLLTNMVSSSSPIFHLGWFGDFPDPHNFIHEFMYSKGAFSQIQRYNNTTTDDLIEEGLRTLNTTRRKEIYYQLQEIYHEECISAPTVQPLERHWERDHVQGWYYNPAYPGNYFYHLWKQSTLYGDLNNDGVVDIYDIVTIAEAFGSVPGDPNWNSIADLVQDEVIDIFDVVLLAKNFGRTA